MTIKIIKKPRTDYGALKNMVKVSLFLFRRFILKIL